MDFAIETQNLSRRFGRTTAVKEMTMTVPQGSVFALLGPNGAGKTTTIKVLMNILEPSAGKAFVLGTESPKLGSKHFQQIGYVSENQELPEWMTVRELLDYCEPMYPSWNEEFSERLLRQFGLDTAQKIRDLSRGSKIKTALLSSLSYRPRLLVLDEPFAGLDPLARDELIRGTLELCEQERWTVFIASNDIDEVERLADQIAVLDGGELRVCESVASLQAHFRHFEVIVKSDPHLPARPPRDWLAIEKAAHTVRFIHTRYLEGSAEREVHSVFPGAQQVITSSMSLKEIFLVLGRSRRRPAA